VCQFGQDFWFVEQLIYPRRVRRPPSIKQTICRIASSSGRSQSINSKLHARRIRRVYLRGARQARSNSRTTRRIVGSSRKSES
jgi:hypothetical protein